MLDGRTGDKRKSRKEAGTSPRNKAQHRDGLEQSARGLAETWGWGEEREARRREKRGEQGKRWI